ncbi:MAG: hypothetical protein ACE5M4_03630 [Anaerolineales bacterium]
MLWYDDSPQALKARVKQAAGFYSEKYGRKPNLCLVHPGMLKTDEGIANGVVIRKGKGIMPGHFWIGVDEAQLKSNGNGKKPSKARSQAGGSKVAKPKSKSKTSKAATKPAAKAASKRKSKSKSTKAKTKTKRS